MKLKAALIALLSASFSSHAVYIDTNYEYNPSEPSWYKLLDLAESWVRKQGSKTEGPSEIVYVGQAPSLGAWRRATRDWTPGACLSSVADNTGVWISDPSKATSKSDTFFTYDGLAGKTSSYKEYVVSTGAPFEFESKNYKSAGLKRFADYYHSFRVDGPNGLSTVIDKKQKHSYRTSHVFALGQSTLNSTTLSNFEFFIGIGGDFSDFSYQEGFNWADWSKYKVKAKLKGKNFYLSDCGFSSVIAERNTKPVIHGVDFDRATQVGGGGFLNTKSITFKPRAEDKHSAEKNLIYSWVINGQVHYGKTPHFTVGTYVAPKTYSYRLTVSDGDMSTLYIGSTRF